MTFVWRPLRRAGGGKLAAWAGALLILGGALLSPLAAQNVVLNEIHYHPASRDVREEFVELYNAGSTNVSLAGWTLGGGISFPFPSNTVLGAGRYLVVAADRARFAALRPAVTNVTGSWLGAGVTNVNGRFFTNFSPVLGNTRDTVRLRDGAGRVIDEVTYADEGDWAIRRRGSNDLGYRGWTWYAEHDGLGRTLEVRNPALPNEHGQNWGASAVAGGTPGAPNSIRTEDLAPLIVDVTHLPAVPRSTDPITVRARILDEVAGVPSVVLRWRLDGAATFASTPMQDDGASGDGAAWDGVFGVVLPPQANQALVEFYLEATDAEGYARIWPAPALAAPDQGGGSLGPVANALFQVDNAPQQTNAAPLYKLILTAAEQTELGNMLSGAPNSDAEMNATFLSLDATGVERRYLASVRNRGHGSRSGNPHNYRVNFPSDTPWKDTVSLNLNARTVPAQVIGAAVAQRAGAAGNNSRFALLRINNGAGPGGTPANGLYAANEDINADWASRQFPRNGGGNIYSVVRDLPPSPYPNFNYRGETVAEYQRTYVKQSNSAENDWRDLMGMLQVMGENQTGSFTLEAARRVANLDQWLTHLAVMNILGNNESGVNTGNNDDYYWYRGLQDPRFVFAYHDLDTVLGLGGSAAATDTNIFRSTCCPISGDSEGIWRTMNFFLHHPDIEPLYYRKLQDLLNGPFAASPFNAVVDQVFNDFPQLATTASNIKGWMATRRTTLQGVLTGRVPPATNAPVAVVSGQPRSPTWRTQASLSVGGWDVTHYRWRLNGGTWSAEAAVSAPILLGPLPHGSTNRVEVVGRNAVGIYQAADAATVTPAWIIQTNLPPVRLNEILARNDGAVNHAGTFPDLIELCNEGTTPVPLDGLRLSDDPAAPGKFTFPAGTTLAPGACLTVFADAAATPGLHTGFGLNQAGDTVLLFHSVAAGGVLLDSVAFGPQVADVSLGRVGAGGAWTLVQPSLHATNVARPLGNRRNLRLNEWLAASTPPITLDFLELYNPDSLPVALGGLFLSREPLGDPAQHRVADYSYLAPGGCLAFLADGEPHLGPDHLGFGLPGEQGHLGLFDADLTPIDAVVYGPQRPNVSQGRCPNGSGTLGPQSFATPGLPNSCITPPPPPQAITLIPVNQTWTYFTNGVTPAPNWMAPDYDDSGWDGSGPAMLGRVANSVPEPVATPLAQPTNRVTYYFRTRFQVPAGASFTSLQISNLIDDGAVFYLNGTEVGRIRLPDPPTVITSNTIATSITAAAWSLANPASFGGSVLRPGENVMAVEVHQNSLNSADIVMAVRLDGLIVTNTAAAAGLVISEVLASNARTFITGGRTPDLIELHNPSANAVDLAGLSLADRPAAGAVRWSFPPGSIIPARGYFMVVADPGAPASPTNTGFALGAAGGGVYLFKKAPDTNEILDQVLYGLQVTDYSIGRLPVTGTNWVLTLPTFGATNVAASLGPQAGLRVNEWMADPAAGDDWFEVFNPGPEPVLLSGLALTDNYGTLNPHVIPALSYIGIGSNAWQRFVADNPAVPAGPDHVNFKLGRDGDAIFLLASNGATLLDAVSFGPQLTGVSGGRLPDGAAAITAFPVSPTPGEANYLPLATVAVNEVLTHTDLPLEDAIELRNLTGAPVAIGGWYLSDDQDAPRKFRIPPGTVLPAHGFAVFYEAAFNNDSTGAPFSLSSAEGDQVYLSEADTNGLPTGHRAVARFGAAARGVSFGRYVNSVGTVDYPALSALSLGSPVTAQSPPTQANLDLFRTGPGAPNPYPRVGPVVITEIMYHPPDLVVSGLSTNDNTIEEFIELRNTSASLVTLHDPLFPSNGWRLRDAVEFAFGPAHSLPPGGSLLVVSFDPATNLAARAQFQARYGSNAALAGPWSGKLDNSGDSVELVRPDAPQADGMVPQILVEKVVYGDLAPWPPAADGGGFSLQRVTESGYANDPTNWVAAAPTPAPASVADNDGDGMPDDWEVAHGFQPGWSGDAALDADLDGLSNREEYLAGTDPRSAASTLQLQATLGAGGGVTLQFNAVAGRTYSLLRSATMPAAGGWIRWVDVPAPPAGGPVSTHDDPASPGQQRFYRLVTPGLP